MKALTFLWLILAIVKGLEIKTQEVISLIKKATRISKTPISWVLTFIIMSIIQEEMIFNPYFTWLFTCLKQSYHGGKFKLRPRKRKTRRLETLKKLWVHLSCQTILAYKWQICCGTSAQWIFMRNQIMISLEVSCMQ